MSSSQDGDNDATNSRMRGEDGVRRDSSSHASSEFSTGARQTRERTDPTRSRTHHEQSDSTQAGANDSTQPADCTLLALELQPRIEMEATTTFSRFHEESPQDSPAARDASAGHCADAGERQPPDAAAGGQSRPVADALGLASLGPGGFPGDVSGAVAAPWDASPFPFPGVPDVEVCSGCAAAVDDTAIP
eukprot:CAMPEP_0173469490 /NCGR_PEP_ID=MMETSP1357-20121228/77389_1 /TAXON_ID=77926 /ORGANISM="Hemiselmis rufescens, Strain PCC563" /LENGTH=189 /DNA_ID=CAMNT_0014437735 /DNA_START=471 /DNA_END=1041 /DNA_ORIENTATION=+